MKLRPILSLFSLHDRMINIRSAKSPTQPVGIDYWFRQYFFTPYFVSICLLFLTLLSLFVYLVFGTFQNRSFQMDLAANALAIGIQQQDRSYVENILIHLSRLSESNDIQICQGNKSIYSLNRSLDKCESQKSKVEFRKAIPGGDPTLALVARFDYFKTFEFIFGTMALFLVFSLPPFIYFLLSKKQIRNSLLLPLKSALSDSIPSPIIEIQNIISEIQDTAYLRIEMDSARRLQKQNQEIAHDLKSPTQALKTILSSHAITDNEIHALAQAAFERFEKIIGLLLEGPAFNQEPQHLKINEWIKSIVAEKESLYPHAKFEVLEPENETKILSSLLSELDFVRILSNLIDNSIQASPDGAKVTLSWKFEFGRIQIEVEDQGTGMTEEILNKIGERGYSSKFQNNHGLGVHSAREILTRIQGTLDYKSKPGQGTIAIVTLPVSSL